MTESGYQNIRASSHSREGSLSEAGSEISESRGLVLSVSSLQPRGARDGSKDSPRSDDSGVILSEMGGIAASHEAAEDSDNMDNMVRLEPEGINEEDQSQNCASSLTLSVDKRLFGRLQEELTQAQSLLKLKEEQVVKLSRIRDDIEGEMEDLTASLFQEAHKMVQEANVKRAQAEKSFAESEMKVEGLESEVTALKAMVITSTPSMPNKSLNPSHHRVTALDTSSSGDPASPSSPGWERPHRDSVDSGASSGEADRHIDPILRQEYLSWKKAPDMSESSLFMTRIYREDVELCLQFPATDLAAKVRTGIHANTLCLIPVKPDTGENPRNCALLDQPRTVRYKLVLDGEKEEHYICQLARNRLTSVCDFLTYCRYVTQGMVKSPVNDVYWEIMELRRKMASARLGFNI